MTTRVTLSESGTGKGRVNLCFHGVGTPSRELETGEVGYWVTERRFLEILDAVADRPGVNLSFDDGNASDLEVVLPALVRRGLSARFFVLAGRLDEPGSLRTTDVAALREAGMLVGSHGMHHRRWRGLDDESRRAEFVEARDRIEQAVGTPVTEVACPLGDYDRTVLAHLRRLGYQRVHTSDRRRARPSAWIQPRYSVTSGDDAASVARIIDEPPPALERARLAAVGVVKRIR